MLRVSVSDLDLFRSFKEDDDFTMDAFLMQLRRETPATPAMQRGHAFAVAMEHANLGTSDVIAAEGHAFQFNCDAEIESMPRREFRGEKEYDGVVVSARCDRLRGRVIADDKTTARFDAEGYIERFQWRFYLDIFDADVFRWHIWECREMAGEIDGHELAIAWNVSAHHLLTQYRYEGMEADCAALVKDFARFAATIGYNRAA